MRCRTKYKIVAKLILGRNHPKVTWFLLLVHGGWSSWSVSTPCSVICGNGTQVLSRTCTNPAPKYGGRSCQGDSQRKEAWQKRPSPGEYFKEWIKVLLVHIVCLKETGAVSGLQLSSWSSGKLVGREIFIVNAMRCFPWHWSRRMFTGFHKSPALPMEENIPK